MEAKRIPVLENLPPELQERIGDAAWYDSSGCSGTAKTYFLEGVCNGSNAFLKVANSGNGPSLARDAEVLRWLDGKVPVAKVLHYSSQNGREYLLTTQVYGNDATKLLDRPEEMVPVLGHSLRLLHSLPITDCPIDTGFSQKLETFKDRIRFNPEQVEVWDDPISYMTPGELYQASLAIASCPEDRVFTHGDYCLPNVVIDNGRLSGFVDLGNAGIGDRYYDLAWALWSLCYNLGSREWESLFLKSYGIDTLDLRKVKLYLALDQNPLG